MKLAVLNPQAKYYYELMGIDTTADIDFTLNEFASHDDIMNYLEDSNYEISDEMPGMCFGFSVKQKAQDDIDVKLIFSG
jgi:hypothetical protein